MTGILRAAKEGDIFDEVFLRCIGVGAMVASQLPIAATAPRRTRTATSCSSPTARQPAVSHTSVKPGSTKGHRRRQGQCQSSPSKVGESGGYPRVRQALGAHVTLLRGNSSARVSRLPTVRSHIDRRAPAASGPSHAGPAPCRLEPRRSWMTEQEICRRPIGRAAKRSSFAFRPLYEGIVELSLMSL